MSCHRTVYCQGHNSISTYRKTIPRCLIRQTSSHPSMTDQPPQSKKIRVCETRQNFWNEDFLASAQRLGALPSFASMLEDLTAASPLSGQLYQLILVQAVRYHGILSSWFWRNFLKLFCAEFKNFLRHLSYWPEFRRVDISRKVSSKQAESTPNNRICKPLAFPDIIREFSNSCNKLFLQRGDHMWSPLCYWSEFFKCGYLVRMEC